VTDRQGVLQAVDRCQAHLTQGATQASRLLRPSRQSWGLTYKSPSGSNCLPLR
jgi:hypothetical protein